VPFLVPHHRVGNSRLLLIKLVSFQGSRPVITDTPMRIQFPMRAGREYTFNVGVWAFADNTSGVGTSATVSGITGVIPSMTVDGI